MLTRESVKKLRDDLQTIINRINENEELEGVKLILGSGSFGDSVTFKLEAAPLGDDGEAVSKTATAFTRYASMYNLLPSDLGKEISWGGSKFVITGLNTRSYKYPILAKRSDGKVFKLPATAAGGKD